MTRHDEIIQSIQRANKEMKKFHDLIIAYYEKGYKEKAEHLKTIQDKISIKRKNLVNELNELKKQNNPKKEKKIEKKETKIELKNMDESFNLTVHSYLRYLQKIKREEISEADIKINPHETAKRYESKYPTDKIKRELLKNKSQPIYKKRRGVDICFSNMGSIQIRIKNNKIITVFPVEE